MEIEQTERPPLDLQEAKWQRVELAMRIAKGNQSEAARLLGVDRTTLGNWLKSREAA